MARIARNDSSVSAVRLPTTRPPTTHLPTVLLPPGDARISQLAISVLTLGVAYSRIRIPMSITDNQLAVEGVVR
jgi:hypothetical protein